MARVGGTPVSSGWVASVAAARGISPRHALDRILADELMAQGARERQLDRSSAVIWASAAVVAGRVAAHFSQLARTAGPPTDDELSTRLVVHAVVLRSRALSPSAGLFLASSVEQAVAAATSAEDFERRARSIHSDMAKIVVERVGPFGADGLADAGDSLDPTFVAAAFSLREIGQTSRVIETRFGWHVIRLVERIAPSAIEARRSELAGAVIELRARSAIDAVLADRRARTPIEIESGVDALMAAAYAGVQ